MKKSRKPLQFWTNNIVKCYLASTEEEKAEGLGWYHQAYEWSQLVAKDYGLRPHVVVGTLAALSPMTLWEQNLKDTAAIIINRRARVTTYLANKRKALGILRGWNPRTSLGKFKTLSFYNCIMGSTNDVCIDRHAGSIAFGRTLTDQERGKLTGRLYERVQNAYREASKSVGLIPSALQAVTWVHWRNQK